MVNLKSTRTRSPNLSICYFPCGDHLIMKDLYERMKPFISEAISVTHERFPKFSSILSDFIHSNKIVITFDVCRERDVRFITAINFMPESSDYYWHEEGCWGYASGCSLAIGEDYANPVDGFILSK